MFEDTYTVDEIVEMLDGLQTVVYSEMETELVNSNHMSVLLLRQLLTQAEKWHLNLSADMSLLENRLVAILNQKVIFFVQIRTLILIYFKFQSM